MYTNLIKQIKEIASRVLAGEIDYSGIPLSELMEVIVKAAESIEDNGNEIKNHWLCLLDNVTAAGDQQAFNSLLFLWATYLEDVDKTLLRSKLALSYRDILTVRMPEYHFMKNNIRLREYYEKNKIPEGKPFTGKGVVYCVVTGNYDQIREPKVINKDWDYILYTDSENIDSKVWRVRKTENKDNLDNRLLARKYKILGHEYLCDYDYSIYVDGKLQIIGDLTKYIEMYSCYESMLCMNHYLSADAYEEAELCKENGFEDPGRIDAQMIRYRQEGFPEGWGQVDTAILVRNHRDRKLKETMSDWWSEVAHCTARDQLSFTYCCWKNSFLYDSSPLFIADNDYVYQYKHV